MSTSTPSSGSVTPGSPQPNLNQTYYNLPQQTRAVSSAPQPRLANKLASSSVTKDEFVDGVENVNRLWSLFENVAKDIWPRQSGNPFLDLIDSESESEEAQNEIADISTVVHQAEYIGLRVLQRLSFHERGQALIVAMREGYVRVVDALLNKQTNLYVADEEGVTALRLAAETGQLKILAYLLNANCSVEPLPSAKDRRDAIECAEQSGQITAAVMIGLYTNIRLSMIESDHPYRHCRGQSPAAVRRHRDSTS